MSATFSTARDEILDAFKTAWDAGAGALNSGTVPTVFWDGVPEPVDKPHDAPWARIQIRHGLGGQTGIGRNSPQSRFTKTGVVTVQVFQPLAQPGLSQSEGLAEVAKSAFEGVSTASCVIFRNVRINEVGATDAWYQMNVLAEFEYDEFVDTP